jgi:hypothetical protein
MTSGVVVYILASFSRISVLGRTFIISLQFRKEGFRKGKLSLEFT